MTIDESIFQLPEEAGNDSLAYKDDDSYALRFLKYLFKNKLVVKFLSENNIFDVKNGSFYSYIYGILSAYVRKNRRRCTYTSIFILRAYLPPMMWFYKVTEELPESTKFYPAYKTVGKEQYAKNTLAHEQLIKIREQEGDAVLSSKYDIPKYTCPNLLCKRKRKDGSISFRNLPSYDIIKMFQPLIKPDLWFIYPEELEPSSAVEQRKLDYWEECAMRMNSDNCSVEQIAKWLAKSEIQIENLIKTFNQV